MSTPHASPARRPARRRRSVRPLAAALIALALIALTHAAPAPAEEFTAVGPRALGMGGAGVASTRGSLGMYWNPAALAPPRRPRVDEPWDVALSLQGGAVEAGEIISKLQNIENAIEGVDLDQLDRRFADGQPIGEDLIRGVLRVLDEIPPLAVTGTGLQANITPAFHARVGRFGFSAMALINGGGLTNVDLNLLALGPNGLDGLFDTLGNLPSTPGGSTAADSLTAIFQTLGVADPAGVANELIYQAEQAGIDVTDPEFLQILEDAARATENVKDVVGDIGEAIQNNQTGVNLRGIALQEYGVGYSHPLFDLVSVGVGLKFLHGTTYFNPIRVWELDRLSGILQEFFEDSEQENSMNFGVDVGVLVMPADWVSIGVVGKYLNRPRFDFALDGETYAIEPQFRGGVALGPFAGFSLAADLDLLSNKTDSLPGFDSQIIGGGVEYNVAEWDVLFLRGGVSKNLAEAAEDPVVHAGLGLRVFGAQIDLSGMLSTRFVDIGELQIPQRGAASLQLSLFLPLP